MRSGKARRSGRPGRPGFTLMAALVAAAVLAASAALLSGAVGTSVRVGAEQRDRARLALIARSEAEKVLAADIATLASAEGELRGTGIVVRRTVEPLPTGKRITVAAASGRREVHVVVERHYSSY